MDNGAWSCPGCALLASERRGRRGFSVSAAAVEQEQAGDGRVREPLACVVKAER